MRKPFSGHEKPVKLSRVIIFLTFDALDPDLPLKKKAHARVHPESIDHFLG